MGYLPGVAEREIKHADDALQVTRSQFTCSMEINVLRWGKGVSLETCHKQGLNIYLNTVFWEDYQILGLKKTPSQVVFKIKYLYYLVSVTSFKIEKHN